MSTYELTVVSVSEYEDVHLVLDQHAKLDFYSHLVTEATESQCVDMSLCTRPTRQAGLL
jgi:hypothetical protein